jgi:hypothetical protein
MRAKIAEFGKAQGYSLILIDAAKTLGWIPAFAGMTHGPVEVIKKKISFSSQCDPFRKSFYRESRTETSRSV